MFTIFFLNYKSMLCVYPYDAFQFFEGQQRNTMISEKQQRNI